MPRRFILPLLVPLLLVAVGTVGYRLIEGPEWTWNDAAYMTVITLTTVGYGETHPLSPAGRSFTMFLCLGGVAMLAYVSTQIIRAVIDGELQAAFGRKTLERNLGQLQNHYIVCGYGRMGRMVCREFEANRLPYVVIDRDEKLAAEFGDGVGLFVAGDATADDVLHHAGVTRAKALVTVASSDADNLYITLSARVLNDKLFIVARAEEASAEEKLRRVGANQVVSPYVIGGHRVAHAVLRPAVVDFIELATRTDFVEIQIEEVKLRPGSPLVGKTLAACGLHREFGIMVVAIKKTDGSLNATPSGDVVLEANSILVAIGHRKQLDKLDELAAGK